MIPIPHVYLTKPQDNNVQALQVEVAVEISVD